jgi:hypothetical protein
MDGKRLFVMAISINYTLCAYRIRKAGDLLKDMATRKNLDSPNDLPFLADGIKTLHHIEDNQGLISLHLIENEKYRNLINQA